MRSKGFLGLMKLNKRGPEAAVSLVRDPGLNLEQVKNFEDDDDNDNDTDDVEYISVHRSWIQVTPVCGELYNGG